MSHHQPAAASHATPATLRRPTDADAPARPDRRRFVRLAGGGVVFAAGAASGLAGCAGSALPERASAAWREAATQTDLRRHMLAHALLAPNPHNRQPWLADLGEAPDRITLRLDAERLLPETDPHGRQIVVGCGTFVELAVIAAAQRGVAVTVTPFPQGAPAPGTLPRRGTVVATLQLHAAGSAQPDALFAQALARRTNKTAYASDRALPPALLAAWADTAARFGMRQGVASAPAQMAELRRITREAYEIECVTPRTWLESARLFRIGPKAIETHRDGIAITGTMPRLMHTLGLFDPLEVPQRGSSNFERVMARWPAFETGSGYLWLAGPGNSRATELAAGRAYLRMALQATAAGADLHPLSQALQEFPEVAGPYAEVHRQFGLDPARQPLQMLARAGFALQPVAPSPRRGLDAVVQA
jgi:hypothetical protein